MLANFFDKSKPVNFILIAALFCFAFFIAVVPVFLSEIATGKFLLESIGLFLFFSFLFFLFNFILAKNNLTFDNSYAFLFFVLFLCFFPTVFQFTKPVYVTVFLLFFLRKIYSLESFTSSIQKLFDAGFWLGIAVLIEPSAIVFVALLYAAIYNYHKINIQRTFVPIVGFCTPLIVYVGACLYSDISLDFSRFVTPFETMDTSMFEGVSFRYSFIFVSVFVGVAILVKTPKALAVSNAFKKSWLLVVFNLVLSIFLMLWSTDKSETAVIYFVFPVAIILANGMEALPKKWVKELFIYGLFLGAIGSRFL